MGVITAQQFEYAQVIGTDDARGRALHERGNERERLVEGGLERSKTRGVVPSAGSSIPGHRRPCPNRNSSSCASSALGRSRSTPGRAWTPRTVANRNGGGSDGWRRFRASSNVLAIKALTLMPRALAARRTCLASWSTREMVVLTVHQHNIPSSLHQYCQDTTAAGARRPKIQTLWRLSTKPILLTPQDPPLTHHATPTPD